MSQELDRLIQKAINNDQRIFNEIESNGFTKEDYIQALTEKTKKQVYKEIKEEVKAEIIAEAEKDIDKMATDKKMKEIKKLVFTGLFLAFFVGLLVNQCTEVITIWKKMGFISTGMTIVVLFIISGLIAVYIVLKDLYELWKGTLGK